MPFWDDLGTSGWNDGKPDAPVSLGLNEQATPVNSSKTLPSDQEILTAWNANRQDPAAVYKLMQQNGVSTTQLARVLNIPDVTPGVLADYLNTGQKQTNPGSMINDNGPATFDYNARTAPSTETKEQFLASVTPDMLNADGTFKAPKQGGNYMDTGMTPEHVWEVANMPENHWFNDETAAHPGALSTGRDTMLDPHWQNGVQDTGGVVGNAWRAIGRPVATIAALMYGGGELAGAGSAEAGAGAAAGGTGVGGSAGLGSGTVLGGGAATAPTASGLAGTLGMSPGMGATALNSGALNAGVSLARGNSLGDSVKAGIIGAAMSPVGTIAGNATTSALGTSVSPLVSQVAGNVAGNAAQGGVGAALTNQDVGQGIIHGAQNGIIDSAGNIVGGAVGSAADSNLAGSAASAVTKSTLNGSSPLDALTNVGVNAAANQILNNVPGFANLSPSQKSMAMVMVSSTLSGKTPTQALIDQATNLATAQISGAQPSNKTRGW